MARLVELALVVPIEVSSRLIDAVPMVVDKVPSAANRVRREIVLARFLGKLAVDQGLRELRSRLAPSEDSTAPAGNDTSITGERLPEQTTRATVPSEGPDVDTLALADYDHLSSAQIVAKLEGLEPAERAAIEQYERAGRHRRTILGKLEQLDEGNS